MKRYSKIIGIWVVLLAHTISVIAKTVEHMPYNKDYQTPFYIYFADKDRTHDISCFASFLYYYTAQDGLDLANSGAIATTGGSTGTVYATDNSIGLFQDFKYTPGFQLGVDVADDSWVLHTQYTRVMQTTNTLQSAILPNPDTGNGVWIINNWFQQLSSVGQTISATTVASTWNASINLADVTLGHTFYEDYYATLTPFFGVRGAWISQNLNIGIDIPSQAVFDAVRFSIGSYNSVNSWAIGPRAGAHGAWLFGHGIRFQGVAAVNLLCTRFTSVAHSEDLAISPTGQLSTQFTNINCVRPQLDLSLGFAWGTYFEDENCYLDICASYDFLVFWQQNMMRKLVDQSLAGIGSSAGDLYLQGISISAAVYF